MDSPSSADARVATSFLSKNNTDQLNDGLSDLRRFVVDESPLKDQAAAVIKIISKPLKAGYVNSNKYLSSNTVM
jgi:hypothetical protein